MSSMKHIAVVVGSKYGQTQKIGEFLRSEFAANQVDAQVFTIKKGGDQIDLSSYDGVVIGSPVFAGKYLHQIIEWVQINRSAILQRNSAFYSVSLNAADKREQARKEDDRLLSDFIEKTGLKPAFLASIAGALKYPKYNFFIKWIMKRISSQTGGPTDTSKEYEMTDWDQVKRFAAAFLNQDKSSSFALNGRFKEEKELSLTR